MNNTLGDFECQTITMWKRLVRKVPTIRITAKFLEAIHLGSKIFSGDEKIHDSVTWRQLSLSLSWFPCSSTWKKDSHWILELECQLPPSSDQNIEILPPHPFVFGPRGDLQDPAVTWCKNIWYELVRNCRLIPTGLGCSLLNKMSKLWSWIVTFALL